MNPWLRFLHKFIPFRRTTAKPIDFMDISDEEEAAWWGKFQIETEQSRYLKVGKTILCIDRYQQEWRIACSQETTQTLGYMLNTQSKDADIHILPVLPKHSMIFYLENELFIPPKGESLLYGSIPIYIRVELGAPPKILEEIPTQTLTETWYGPDTQTGELCYAAPLPASANLDNLPHDSTQVICPISIVNHRSESLLLKEIYVPLPSLSIYHDLQNHLWTEQLHVLFDVIPYCETIVEKGPALGLKNLTLLNPARLHKTKRK